MDLALRDADGHFTPLAQRAFAWGIIALEVAFLVYLAFEMYDVRMATYDGWIQPGDDAQYYFLGSDPYYHLRAVVYSVHNFPELLRWDPYTQFPFGTDPGQFGTLFDLIVAGAVLVQVGAGASVKQVADVLAGAPPVFGALLVFPAYLLARRYSGRIGAIAAACILAILPGEYLVRSIAGYGDHHVAENLFLTIAALGVVIALQRAHKDAALIRHYREAPMKLLPAIAAAAFGGLGMAAYVWVWPPGILFIAIALGAFLLHFLMAHARGDDVLPVTFAGTGILVFTFLCMSPMMNSAVYTFNTFGRLQPLFALAGAAALVAAYALAHGFKKYRIPRYAFPVVGAAIPLLGVAALAVTAPSVWGGLKWGLSWITGIGVSINITTIAEAQGSDMATIRAAYGFLYTGAILGFLPLAWRIARRARAEDTLLLVWSLTFLIGAFNQVRFTYYFAVNVALLIGLAVGTVASIRFNDLAQAQVKTKDRRKRAAAQASPQGGRFGAPVGAVLIAALFIFPATTASTDYVPAWERIPGWEADGNLRTWTTEAIWLRDHSPGIGVDLQGTFARHTPPPEPSYGVLAWWDYGHLIEIVAERPPVANPFQQAAPLASLYFTSQSEEEAEGILANYTEGRNVRYVMIDDESAAGKFGAITVWAHMQDSSRGTMRREQGSPGDLYGRESFSFDGSNGQATVMGPEYRQSMMSRLFDDDANGLHHYRLVREAAAISVIGNVLDREDSLSTVCVNSIIPTWPYCPFRVPADAAQYVNTNIAMPVDLVRSDGSVDANSGRFYAVDVRMASPLKTFERVAGALLSGEGAPESSDVYVSVPVRGAAHSFEWRGTVRSDSSGHFEIVVPYSTTEPVPVADGGTAIDVKATGPYTARTSTGVLLGEAEVPDRAVLDGETVTFTIA